MPTTDRVKAGSKTKGSTSAPVGADSISGKEFDEQRQGVNLRNSFDQTTSLFFKIRVNSDETITRNGRDVSDVFFDETIATVNFSDAEDRISNVNIGSTGRISSRMTHIMENRDLGQSHIYDDQLPFFDTQDIDPIHVVQTNPLLVELPPALADHNSLSSLDGVIDIFSTRRKIDRESLEAPYFAKGIRGSFGLIEDAHRRSNEIFTGLNSDNTITENYLDSQETMGVIVDSFFRGVLLQGFHSEDSAAISPFSEVSADNDRARFYESSGVDNEIKSIMIHSITSSLDNYKSYDKMALTGYRYENNNIGVDSIAFGGLLK